MPLRIIYKGERVNLLEKFFNKKNDIKVVHLILKDSTPEQEKVIFNKPATIVYWNDGTKTVVKCQNGEEFDPEKGIALCYMKKICGNTGRYNELIKKSLK